MNKKKIPPFEIELDTYKHLQTIIAKRSYDTESFVSIREVLVLLIEKEYLEISGSIRW